MPEEHRYAQRGVSSMKSEVHAAIRNLDKGLFPSAFCKILPDIVGGDTAFCNILHSDTAGTKTSLAYVYWKETGDISVWQGIAQDAIVMNLDDMACVGCIDDFLLSNTIGRNKHLITGEVISAIIDGTADFIQRMSEHGIRIRIAGGETADVGDIVRTIDVGYTAFARMQKQNLVINRIKTNAVIIGVASFGQSTYEQSYNSGISSNGLTSARHDMLSGEYRNKYPESFDPHTPSAYIYTGKRSVDEKILFEGHEFEVGKMLLSPTRTFLPVLKPILREFHPHIHGIIHNTGGGQTKVLRFLSKTQKAVKSNLLEVPPIFRMIQEESGASWHEMYQVFNMGSRLEIYVPEDIAEDMIDIIKAFKIDAQVIGHVESAEERSVEVRTNHGTFTYQ